MALHLTPDMLEKAYELLRTTAPFRGWRLPGGDAIEFKVAAFGTHLAHYQWTGTGHSISVSAKASAHLDTLMRLMAHEMIHLYQRIKKVENKNQHNADFRRRAKAVCRVHGFDPALFC